LTGERNPSGRIVMREGSMVVVVTASVVVVGLVVGAVVVALVVVVDGTVVVVSAAGSEHAATTSSAVNSTVRRSMAGRRLVPDGICGIRLQGQRVTGGAADLGVAGGDGESIAPPPQLELVGVVG
jgi:hypothetical protein